MAGLTDEQVFGMPQPSEPATPVATAGMTDEQVFGNAPAPPAGLTDEQVFGPAQKPGVLDYFGELAKRFIGGGVETSVAMPLRGLAVPRPDSAVLQKAIENVQGGQDIDKAVADAAANPSPTPPLQSEPLYRAGEAVSKAVQTALPDRKILNPVVGDIAGGFGSLAGNVLSSLVPGGAVSIPLAGMGEAAQTAVQKKANPDQAAEAGRLGTFAGITDFADILIPQLGSTGKVLGLISRVGLRALEGAFIEGGQEGLQQYIQNLIAKGIYKPDQDVWEDVPYNTFIGSVVGGGGAAIGGGHGEAPPQPAPPADVAQSLALLRGSPTVSPPVAVAPPTPPPATAKPPVQGNTVRDIFGDISPPPAPAPVAPALDTPTPPVTATDGPAAVVQPMLDAITLARDDFNRLGPGALDVETMMRLRDTGGENAMTTYKGEMRRLAREADNPGTLVQPLSPDSQNTDRALVTGVPIESDFQPQTIVIPDNVIAHEIPKDQSFFPDTYTIAKGYTVTPVHSAFLSSWAADIGVTPEASSSPLSAAVIELTRQKISEFVPDVMVHMISPEEMSGLARKPTHEAPYGMYLEGPKLRPQIFISSEILGDPKLISHVVLHEGVHALTSRILVADPIFKEGMTLLKNETMDSILAMKDDAPPEIHSWTNPGKLGKGEATLGKVAYAFKTEREFVAEAFSNPTFQHVLANVKISRELQSKLRLEGPKPTLWQAFVQLIRRGLGLHSNLETYSMLEATLRYGSRVMDAQARLPGDPFRPDNAPYVDGLKGNQIALNGQEVQVIGKTPFELEGERWSAATGNPISPEQNLKLIQARIRQLEYDRRLSGTASGEGRTAPSLELTQLRKRLKELSSIPAVGIQPETEGIRGDLFTLFGGKIPPQVKEMGAHADSMNKFYKWMAGLDQLVQANPSFTPLIRYKEVVQEMHLEESKLHDAALRVGKEWRRLGEEGDRLSAFLNELTNMVYRSDIEIKQGVARHPSPEEFQRMVDRHQIGPKGQEVFRKVKTLLDGFLTLIEGNATAKAQAFLASTPAEVEAKQNRLKAISEQMKALKSRPYFPFMRFGRHYLFVKDAAGKLLHFETFERHGLRSAERRQAGRAKEIGRRLDPGDKITVGELPEEAGPLTGMPPLLLQQMSATMTLTPDQLNAVDMLSLADKMGLSPILNPKYQKKYFVPGYSVLVPGYSMDLKRSFAKYFFHGAKFYAKTKYADGLKDLVANARVPQRANWNKESQIANFMSDHLQNTVLDARGDFGVFKGAIFLWAMGYVPAAATQNLSQTPMITFPYLGAKFGDIAASRELVKAMVQLSSYYKRGRYDTMSAFEAKALGYGIKTGRISETQAPELAGMSQGANLLEGIGGNKAQQAWIMFQEKAAWMFEMAEQFNRRIAYRAALNLALQNPKAKIIAEAISFNQREFIQLKAEGWTEAEARAVIAANHVVEQTQYTYARWARPRFMRGSLPGTLFVFKKYIQSTLFMLANNRTDVLPRYLLISALIGGMGGLPGMDDLKSILKAVGAWLFGKNFDLEREARKYILEFSEGKVDPDLILHGLARRGMGIPALLDLMGSFATGRPGRGLAAPRHEPDPVTGKSVPLGFNQNIPFPVLDRSRALGMGQILPFDVGAMATPTSDLNKTIADQTQKASGAVFSVGFNIYKAIMDNHLAASDWKRYERAVPRMIGDLSKSFRAYSEGRERSKGGPAGGSTIVNYDPNDTEQMMEILAMTGGYQPLRVQARWDNILAKVEVEKYYDLQRNGLLEQLYEARSGGRKAEIDDVIKSIRQFNEQLPEEARGKKITSDTAAKSIQTRERSKVAREAGISTQRTNVPIDRAIDKLYPEATIDVRRAPR